MASKDLNNALVETLEHMRHSDLQRFCYNLQRREEPQVGARDLICRNPAKITDYLVSTYSKAGALSVAVEILREMGYYNEAERLAVMEADRKSFIPDPRAKMHFVDKCRYRLIHCVSNVKPILDELLTKRVIQEKSYDRIRALPTSVEKMKELLDCLGAVGVEGKVTFYDIIEKLEPHLLVDIRMLMVTQESDVGRSSLTLDYATSKMRTMMVTRSQMSPEDNWIQRCQMISVRPPSRRVVAQRLHVGRSSLTDYSSDVMSKMRTKIVTRSQMSPEDDWIKLEPEVNSVDPPIYSLQSEAGNFECSISGLHWVCKEKVSFKYQFGSWDEHTERLETMQYIPGGPLLDITVIAGKLDEVYLPHWICTKDNPAILGKFAVLHIDACGGVVEQVAEVTPSHVKLSQPYFSPRGVLMRAGFPVKFNCKVLIYKTSKSFLTLHVYLIPRDPALQQTIEKKESSYGHKMIQKPHPEKSLKMHNRFILTADKDRAKIYPEKIKLIYESSDPNFFEVFVKNPDSDFQLTLNHESGPVWTCEIRKDDCQNTGDIQVKCDEELARVRSELVKRLSIEIINQLLDDLLEDEVLNDEEKDSILQENNTSAKRARCLIDTVKRKGHTASRKMFTHLHSRDPTLSTELGLPSGRPV